MIELRKSVTGELIAFDTARKIIIGSGFDDEEDFNRWLKEYEKITQRRN